MSLETWGDESGDDYAHVDTLIDAGWWPSEQAQEVTDAIKALCAETLYEGGKKDNGVAVRFLARMTMLQLAAGIIGRDDPMAREAIAMFASEQSA